MRPYVAQINIARLRAPLDDPLVAEFAENLKRINALADAAAGFVWRLQTGDGDATSIRAFPDPLTLVNMSVWESVEALRAYVYRTQHRDFVKRRAMWFEDGSSELALWWVPPDHVPTVEEGRRRLGFLATHGASPVVFRFGKTPAVAFVERTTLFDPATEALVGRLNGELAAAYPEPGANHFNVDAESVLPPSGAMVRAMLDGVPVGCGAIRSLSGNRAEVKRMFVDTGKRGLKLGAAILDQLEQEAVALGATELVLETGIRQQAAIGLYERAGFERIPLWGEYLDSPETSVCYGKQLTPGRGYPFE
ncbi:MAG: GNAT family N-acetyltransferase [Gaiella sp.]